VIFGLRAGLKILRENYAANDVSGFSQAGYPSGGMGQLEQIIQNQSGHND